MVDVNPNCNHSINKFMKNVAQQPVSDIKGFGAQNAVNRKSLKIFENDFIPLNQKIPGRFEMNA